MKDVSNASYDTVSQDSIGKARYPGRCRLGPYIRDFVSHADHHIPDTTCQCGNYMFIQRTYETYERKHPPEKYLMAMNVLMSEGEGESARGSADGSMLEGRLEVAGQKVW